MECSGVKGSRGDEDGDGKRKRDAHIIRLQIHEIDDFEATQTHTHTLILIHPYRYHIQAGIYQLLKYLSKKAG